MARLTSLFLTLLCLRTATSRVGREPECSRFHYEEQLLEKMVRMEFNMERIKERLDKFADTEREPSEEGFNKTGKSGVAASVYTRWGRSSCPTGATYIYDGLVAGGHYAHSGGGINYLCLPKYPIWDDGNPTASSAGLVYGTQYETSPGSKWKHLNEHEAPCAVCIAEGPTMMIPARNVCYDGWAPQYHGYLMTSYHAHAGSKEYVCVDSEATATEGSNPTNFDGALFYYVKPVCGALQCPPYDNNKLVTCAVCTRTK